MKKITIALLLLCSLSAATLFVGYIARQQYAQQERILVASEAFKHYAPEQWSAVYSASQELWQTHRNNPKARIQSADWPEAISELRPYQIHLHANEVSLQWTRSADDFAIYLSAVFPHTNSSAPRRSQRTPGIWTIDTRYQNEEVLRFAPGTSVNSSPAEEAHP